MANITFDYLLDRVEQERVDIAYDFRDYIVLLAVFAQYGEDGRAWAHDFCRLSTKYNPRDLDRHFDNIMRTWHSSPGIGALINMARRAGLNV